MRYDIEIGGRLRQVTVQRVAAGLFEVVLEGRKWMVDAARVDASTWSLLIDRDASTRSHEIAVVPEGTAGVRVHVGAVPVSVGLNSRRRWGRKADDHGHTGSGPERIIAPMPGKVVRVLVVPGDAVRARQPVVVIEAMKMENELRVTRDGTVSEIHAKEGQSVESGSVLAVIAPAESLKSEV